MTLDARTQRTILRLVAVFLAAGAGDAIVQFAGSTTYDWRHLAAALVAAAVIAAESYLKDSTELAAPTVAAVNRALQTPPPSVVSSTSSPRTVAPPSEPVAH